MAQHLKTLNVHRHNRINTLRDRHTGVRVGILSGILFLSGIGALIFETLWLRLSGLAFGNSIWAAALILSSFMAGLALGNAIAASSRIRRWRPLHLYALLEVFVALFGCTIVFGLPLLGELLRPVWQMLWNYQPTLLGLRFIVSFVILLVPTTAMGLTLPVLIEDPMLRQTDFGRAIGFLYGSNTLGAVAGAVLGEAYLIGAFGLRGTSLVAGLASCVAAAIAWFVAIREGDTNVLVLQRTFPLRLEVKYRPPDWLHSSRVGSDLVPVPPLVCCIIADCFRNHARGRARRNWPRCLGRWRDSLRLKIAESSSACSSAAGRNRNISVIPVLPGGGDSSAHRCV
jgi:MFS family permease